MKTLMNINEKVSDAMNAKIVGITDEMLETVVGGGGTPAPEYYKGDVVEVRVLRFSGKYTMRATVVDTKYEDNKWKYKVDYDSGAGFLFGDWKESKQIISLVKRGC